MRQFEPESITREFDHRPSWHVLLRSLREAAGITQAGWAARLGYGRRTIQRWEQGESIPDPAATEELARLCFERALYQTYRNGPLAGVNVQPDLLREILADARVGRRAALRVDAPTGEIGPRAMPQIGQRRHNLPNQITSFIGREILLDEISKVMRRARFVTLTGMGGVGKTRLAIQHAHQTVDKYRDGAWLVRLEAVNQASTVLPALAEVLDVGQPRGQSLEDALIDRIRDCHMLIVLDCCEHQLEAVGSICSRLLGACDELQILVTSREPIGMPGEVVIRVPPLSTGETHIDDGAMVVLESEATRLFLDRARAVNASVVHSAESAAATFRICRRLDGLPLAIELAATWSTVLTPVEIEERLTGRFKLLANASRSGIHRHSSMEAALDWSYELLSSDERLLFDRLSVFPGRFDLDAVEHIAASGGLADGLPLLARLVEKSLVIAEPSKDGRRTDYRLLDTVREFAVSRVVDEHQQRDLRSSHARWVALRVDQLSDAIHGSDQQRWFAWVERNTENIREAVDWSLHQPTSELALRLINGVWWSWGVLGRPGEVRSWFERALGMPDQRSQASSVLRAKGLAFLGTVNVLQGDVNSARAILDDADRLATRLGDDSVTIAVRVAQALLNVGQGSPDAIADARSTATLARSLQMYWYEERLLEMQAQAAMRVGDHEFAIGVLNEGIDLARKIGDTWGLAQLLGNLGDAVRSAGDHAEARDLYEQSLTLRSTLGLPGIAPNVRHNLGYVALAERHSQRVREQFLEALHEFDRAGDQRGVAECVIGLAGVEVVGGDARKAVTLFGAAEAALERLGAQIWPSNLADYQRLVSVARARLSRDEFDRGWQDGRLLSLERTIELAVDQEVSR